MKTKLCCLLLMISGVVSAQVVNIPDPNFKAKLIQQGVDENNDGQIQESEALATDYLSLGGANISDLTGIEAFINITSLSCTNNQITTLNVSGLTQLESLYCSSNQITTLNVSGLTQLETLDCHHNQISSINFTNCPQLWTITGNNNLITSIDLTGLNQVSTLSFSSNLISSVIISNPVTLTDVFLNYNQLVHLDLSRVIWMYTPLIDISYNPLQTLNIKNGYSENLNASLIVSNPAISPLQYVCQDENQVVATKNLMVSFGHANCEVNSYCTPTPGGNYNTIVGNIKFDGNNNGCDASDGNMSWARVLINNGAGQWNGYTNTAGNYNFYTQTGNFTLTPTFGNSDWFTITPPNTVVNFTNNLNNIVTRDFCVAANGVHQDVEVVVYAIESARPGFDAVYRIVVRNKGNQVVSLPSGLSFSFDDVLMDFMSSTPSTVAQNTGSLTWDIVNLLPFQTKEIEVTFNINAPTDANPVNIDDVLTFTAAIPLANDENSGNNSFVFDETVVGSFDPNDITCLEGDVVSPAKIGDYLHYNIRFENTGTAAAENIVAKMIVNTADFDIATLELLNASHTVDTRVNGSIIEFVFANIDLGAGQHGNVLMKLKTKSNLQVGDEVNNQAGIYFDYNFPVITNNAETVFQSLSNPDFENDATVSIYPNPSNSIVNIRGNFNIKSTQLFDVQGRLLQTNLVNNTTASIDISAQSNGVYFVKVITDKGIKVEKLVKQ